MEGGGWSRLRLQTPGPKKGTSRSERSGFSASGQEEDLEALGRAAILADRFRTARVERWVVRAGTGERLPQHLHEAPRKCWRWVGRFWLRQEVFVKDLRQVLRGWQDFNPQKTSQRRPQEIQPLALRRSQISSARSAIPDPARSARVQYVESSELGL